MKRWSTGVGVVALVASISICASTLPALGDSTTTTPQALTAAELATQSSFEAMLTGLQGVVTAMAANPTIASGLSSSGTDPSSSIAAAQAAVAAFTPDQLDALQSALAQYPSWQQAPTQLSGAVASFASAASSPVSIKDFTGTFTDSCPTIAESTQPQYVYDEFTATFVANEVQSAAQAVMLAAPGVIAAFIGVDIPTGIKIALAVIWGVANAVFLALSQALAVGQDCQATAFGLLQSAALPSTDSTVLGLQTSSQASIDALIASANATAAQATTVLTAVGHVNDLANGLNTAADTLNTTLTDINTRVLEVQGDLQTLRSNVDILKSTELTALTKADTEIVNLNTFQTLQVRLKIEENLAKTSTGPVGLFQLPAPWGYLDKVKLYVGQTVAALGPANALALAALATANADYNAHHYKLAYTYYAKAYQYVR